VVEGFLKLMFSHCILLAGFVKFYIGTCIKKILENVVGVGDEMMMTSNENHI